MKQSFIKTLILVMAIIALVPLSVRGQVNTATVSGTVTDVSGAVIPGATIAMTNPATGLKRTETTDSNGRFTFTFVPIGTYEMIVEGAGFQTARLDHIQLTASMMLDLPFKLDLQNVQSSVTVSAASEDALQTVTSEQDSTIPQESLNNLPVAHQNWVNLLVLDPSMSTAGGNGSSLSINGLPGSGYNVTVDGTNATSNPEFDAYNVYQGSNIINTVGNDAIAEISVVKGIAPAMIGNTLSGNINIITKGGTDEFHGGLYELNEVSLYDARNQFLTSRPRTTFNQYGGSLGGPVLRHRLLFFTNYEGAKAYSDAVVSGSVPSPYLESISPAIYKPIFALYPTISQPSNSTALIGTYTGTATRIQKDGSGMVRLDSSLDSNNQIAVRYIRARPNLLIPSLIAVNPQTYSGHTDAINANYLHIGKKWTANTRFGFNQIKLTRLNVGFNQKLNTVVFSGFGSGSINGGMYKAFYQHGNFTTYEETIALIHGNHSIEMGGVIQRQNASRYIVQTPILIYSSLAQFQADIPSTAVLELYQVPSGQPPFGFIDYQYGGYIQDDYRVSSSLTLNLGIRYDYFSIPQEYAGRFYNRDVDPANPQLGAGFGSFRPANSLYDADHRGVQPRVGIAWQPMHNTLVHAGFGVFTEGHNFFEGPVNVTQPSATLPFTVGLNLAQAQAAGIAFPIDPLAFVSQITALQASGVLSSKLANYTIPSYNPNHYSLQRFLGIQNALPGGVNLTINYIGSQAVQLDYFEVKNLPGRVTGVSPVSNFGLFNQYSVGDRSNTNVLQTLVEKKTTKGLYLTASYTWGKVLSYGDADILQEQSPQDVNNMKAEYGPAPYDIHHRFLASGRWEIPLNHRGFAHSRVAKEIVEGWQVSGVFTGQTGLPANLVNSGSSYPDDRPDANPGAAHYLSGAGTFPGTHQYLNPQAFAAVPISSLSGAQIRAGTESRYGVRLPGIEDFDTNITKIFPLTEKVHFQLRADGFNTLNHTSLGGLSTSIVSSTFGRLTTATARTMQISGRITF